MLQISIYKNVGMVTLITVIMSSIHLYALLGVGNITKVVASV